jgi:hypothetical protein
MRAYRDSKVINITKAQIVIDTLLLLMRGSITKGKPHLKAENSYVWTGWELNKLLSIADGIRVC